MDSSFLRRQESRRASRVVQTLGGNRTLCMMKFGLFTLYNEDPSILIHVIESTKRICKGFRVGAAFKDETGNMPCGLCPYDFEQTSVVLGANGGGAGRKG